MGSLAVIDREGIMELFRYRRMGTLLVVVAGLMLGSLLLGACGDKVELDNISTKPGATWQFKGKVEAIGSPWWTISQQRILVNNTTTVANDPTPTVGSDVTIQGHTEDGGVLVASTIKVLININLPTVTPSGSATVSGTTAATSTASASPGATGTPEVTATLAPTSTPAPAPTPTVAPPGTVIEINGTIQQITVNNNVTIIIVDNRQYVLLPEVVRVLGSRLVVGVTINFKGRFEEGGQITVINVLQINNQVIVINNPVVVSNQGEDDDKDGGKSNGKCEEHSNNGNCQGDKDKGKDDKGKGKGKK